MSDQLEYHCPQCRKRTLVPAENATETVLCLKCEAPMAVKAKTSQIAEASANAPAASSNKATKKAAGTTKTKAVKAPKAASATATKRSATAKAKAAAEALAAIPIPDFGSFRCPCCGSRKDVAPGEAKPGVAHRCETCFVKLDYLR